MKKEHEINVIIVQMAITLYKTLMFTALTGNY